MTTTTPGRRRTLPTYVYMIPLFLGSFMIGRLSILFEQKYDRQKQQQTETSTEHPTSGPTSRPTARPAVLDAITERSE